MQDEAHTQARDVEKDEAHTQAGDVEKDVDTASNPMMWTAHQDTTTNQHKTKTN